MRNIAMVPGLIAVGCLLAVSSWWIIQLSVLPQLSGVSIGEFSLQAARIMLLVQLLSISLFAPLWVGTRSASTSPRSSAHQFVTPVLTAVYPAWPFLAMLSLVTGKSVAVFSIAEASVLVVGLGLGLAAHLLKKSIRNNERIRLLQTTLGISAAAFAWHYHHAWLTWVGL